MHALHRTTAMLEAVENAFRADGPVCALWLHKATKQDTMSDNSLNQMRTALGCVVWCSYITVDMAQH